MQNDNLPIYQNGITLHPSEEKLLTRKAWSQSRIIAKILQNRPGQGFTFQQMKVTLIELFGEEKVNQDSVKRAMSTMTGTKDAPKSMQDEYGRYPLVKLEEKGYNPETDKYILKYAWNDRYNQLPNEKDLRRKTKAQPNQTDFNEGLFQKAI